MFVTKIKSHYIFLVEIPQAFVGQLSNPSSIPRSTTVNGWLYTHRERKTHPTAASQAWNRRERDAVRDVDDIKTITDLFCFPAAAMPSKVSISSFDKTFEAATAFFKFDVMRSRFSERVMISRSFETTFRAS